MRRWLGALALAAPFAVGLGVASAAPDPLAEEVTTFADPELAESSGLVVIGKHWVSVNDSGDTGRLFVVDPETGRTVRTIPFAEDPVDVEALAPEPDEDGGAAAGGGAAGGAVWVGDIGDNRGRRPHVTLYRVPLAGDSAMESIDLRHPDGPRDAEALLRHPSTGELVVVSKEIFGGTVHRVPAAGGGSGDGVRELQPIGSAPSLVTDGAFLPDGQHLVLRNYARGFVLTWPGLQQVASFALPKQQQGEAIAVESDGSLLLSSEGVHAPVWRMAPVWPAPSGESSAPPSAHASTGQPGTGGSEAPSPREQDVTSERRWSSTAWVLGAVGAVGAIGVVAVLMVLVARRMWRS